MMEKKPSLLCIIGVDGVGKTTHAHKLLNLLRNKNITCKYTWFRFFHFFSLPLLAVCRLTGLTVYEGEGTKRVGKHEFYKSKIVSFIYPWILFIDILPMYFIKIYIPLKFLGYTIISDRFIYDTLVDLMIDTNDFKLYNKLIGKLFLRLIPQDTQTILIDLDESIIRNRRTDLLHDKSLRLRRDVYFMISKEFGIPTIKNNLDIEMIHIKIAKNFGVY